MERFGPLYALASNGKIKLWQGEVHLTGEGHGHILYTFGYEDGKHQVQEKYIKEGKNIGKKNETTPFEQACKDVESKFNKKQDEGYQEDKNTLSTPILPMLALSYEKRGHNIEWPCYVQPKIDGVRCTVGIKNGKINMFTRKGKEMTLMPHIEKDLERLFAQAKALDYDTDHLYFDGELYSDDLTFQELAGTLRRHKNTKETLDKIYLIVFDMFWTNINTRFETRFKNLEKLYEHMYLEKVELIETRLINEDELEMKHQQYIENGYEGIILRNMDGYYKMKHRSADLQKLKMFQDEEFEIIGFKEGGGTEKGCVVWQCAGQDGSFWVRPKGTQEERRELFESGVDYVGKQLTVRYQELTDDGVPRFPVGIVIRDYEEQ